MTVYGKEPKEWIPGRAGGPEKEWKNGIMIDEHLKREWFDALNNIAGIEIRASCEGHSLERVSYVVFRFKDKEKDSNAKKLAKELELKEDGIYALSDIGTEGRARICVAGKIYYGQDGWDSWWESLAEKIEKCVKEAMKEARHRRDQCMECSKPPEYEVKWAEGMGHAWFCKGHFKKWGKDKWDDIDYVKAVKDGKAAEKFGDNPNPDIKDGLVEGQRFNPQDYEPGKLKKLSDEDLIAVQKELCQIFEERGAKEGDELVINAYLLVREEIEKRGLRARFEGKLGRLTGSLTEGKLDGFLIEKAKQIQKLGQIIWKDKYIALTGSAAFVENRLPNDLDTVFRDDEVNKDLLLKVNRIFERYFGVESCPHASSAGSNWRNLPLWDLALVPTKELKFIEMNEPGFIEQFYESLGLESSREGSAKFRNEAAASLREDKILLERYFLTLKPTRPAVPEERMTLESLLKYFKEEDFPANVEKKYDGANHEFTKDGDKITIISEDGEDNTARLPKTVEAVRRLKAKTAKFLGELEAWEGNKHLPREVVSGYLHSHSKPDDSHIVTNVYGVVFLEGEDLHKKSEAERRKALEGMGWPQTTVDEPDLKYRLNLAPSRTAKNTGELKAAIADLRKRPGSEGVVVKKHKAIYYLDRNSRNGWFKLHNTGMLEGIVIEAIETTVRGVYNYRYGIDQGKYKVKPGDLSEVSGREWMEVGKTFSTKKKVGRGSVIEIEFETLNFVKDERSGTVKITAWVPRFMKAVAGKPDSVDEVVSEARRNLILRQKTITKDGARVYEDLVENVEVEYLSKDEYKEWLHETYRIERNEVYRLLRERAFIEGRYDWSPNEEELKETEREPGFGAALRRAGAAAKKLPRFWAVIQNHFRGRSQHKDFRVKLNEHLRGWTIMDQPEGEVTEDVETVEDGRHWQEKVRWKLRPDMDPATHVVATRKAKQPTIWLKWDDKGMGKFAAAEPGSVTATRFEWGVVVQEDTGYAYLTVKKPYFEEYFLDMKHYKGRMVVRLIGVGEKWKKPPKGKLQWQCWFNLKEQTPYLLTRRARLKRDYVPNGEETTASGLPPQWEKKIPHMLRWWGRKLSRSEKLDRMDQAFNYLAEKGELKARPLKRVEEAMGSFTVRRHWWRGQIVVRAMPVQHWDLLIDTGKDYLEEFNLEKDPLIVENLERGIPAFRKKVKTGTPKGGNFRDWMKWEGTIPPGHPEWGNPNKRIPAYMKILDQGKVNAIEESEMFISLEFKGKALKGYVTLKRESAGAAVWVMRRGALPGERRTEQYYIEEGVR